MNVNTNATLRKQARRRVGFRIHATAYVLMTAVQWLIWALTWTGHPWPLYPMLGWGIGLLAHYVAVYDRRRLFSVKRELDLLKH